MKIKITNRQIIKIGVGLSALAIVSIGLLPGLVARFSKTGDLGESARVAEFNIDVSDGEWTQIINTTISPDNKSDSDNNNEIIIKNNSEVTVECTVTIERLTQNIKPTTIKVNYIEGGMKKEVAETYNTKKCEYTKTLKPNDNETSNLIFNWAEGENDINYIGMVDSYAITVVAKQVD